MELRQVKGNTWVLDSWELIPLYRLDAHRCVLLDTGTWDQRDELEAALDAAGQQRLFPENAGNAGHYEPGRGGADHVAPGHPAAIL